MTYEAINFIEKRLLAPPPGNRWFKVNLHVHAEGLDAAELVREARSAEIDVIAVTDHQSFGNVAALRQAASSPGRPLTVLAGIELTAHEGPHILAIFDESFDEAKQRALLSWLGLRGDGNTNRAVEERNSLSDVLKRLVDSDKGIVVIPHPYSNGIGLLDSARKIETKLGWLNSGYISLMQVNEDRVVYRGFDENGNWENRYLLASVRPQDLVDSRYSLAPINASDCRRPKEIADGCTWLRMAQPTVAGLRQVTCEPRTRICTHLPLVPQQDAILAVTVSGGFCDGQEFVFNEGLNCIIGQNHAGKSAVFDFIRFALGSEMCAPEDHGQTLIRRLCAILKFNGKVRLYVRHKGDVFFIVRDFKGYIEDDSRVLDNSAPPLIYRYDAAAKRLDLIEREAFSFGIELYEQGRISRLRNDVGRQLEMIDEFAGIASLKGRRSECNRALFKSADALRPKYERRDHLVTSTALLDALKEEQGKKLTLAHVSEQAKWDNAATYVKTLSSVLETFVLSAESLPSSPEPLEIASSLAQLFAPAFPALEHEEVVEVELMQRLDRIAKDVVRVAAAAREELLKESAKAKASAKVCVEEWIKKQEAHAQETSKTLTAAGVASPNELLLSLRELNGKIKLIERQRIPELEMLGQEIKDYELARSIDLGTLELLDEEITALRQKKAEELNLQLGGQIKVEVNPRADLDAYMQTLLSLAEGISTQSLKIVSREEQISSIVKAMPPRELARALCGSDKKSNEGEGSRPLHLQVAGVTPHTFHVLRQIANNIQLINRLETAETPDRVRILVRRQGEEDFAELATQLSQGEQSAAILTLAMQTRTLPLLVDQPEDELGYSFVVQLVVPKVLRAKFARQLMLITHNANIPVLGDADYVIKMVNNPIPGGERACVAEATGTFENPRITRALVELEGGQRAFEFREKRYKLG